LRSAFKKTDKIFTIYFDKVQDVLTL